MSKDILAGIHAVASALKYDSDNVVEMMVAEDSRNPRIKSLLEDAKERGIRVHHRSLQALDKLTSGERHQGVVAFYNGPAVLTDSNLPALIEQAGTRALFLILDEITDPHNFGACLRSALAANVSAVIVPKDRAAPTNATVRRSSVGAADRVPIVRAANLVRAMDTLRAAGVWITGLEGDAESSLYSQNFKGAVAIAVGSEDEGMRRLTKEHCDFLVKIPMLGALDSLNVSVAASIALFEVLRQRNFLQ